MKRIHVLPFSSRGDRRGEGYIETAVGVFVAMVLVVFSLNVFRLFSIQADLDQYAKQVLETAVVNGAVGEKTDERIASLTEQTGLDPEVSFDGTVYWTSGSRAVQYGEQIRVTVTYTASLSGFGVLSVPVTLRASASGLSRRYWK